MNGLTKSTCNGYMEFLESQSLEPGEAIISCILFNDKYEIAYEGFNINDAPGLKEFYVATGMTAMNDVIGKVIVTTGTRLSKMAEDDRPGKVLFVIITDGKENSSHEYTYEQIAAMIKEQREVYNWEFMFIGANIDVEQTAAMMNIPLVNTITYAATNSGIHDMYATMNNAIMSYRSVGKLNINSVDLTSS